MYYSQHAWSRGASAVCRSCTDCRRVAIISRHVFCLSDNGARCDWVVQLPTSPIGQQPVDCPISSYRDAAVLAAAGTEAGWSVGHVTDHVTGWMVSAIIDGNCFTRCVHSPVTVRRVLDAQRQRIFLFSDEWRIFLICQAKKIPKISGGWGGVEPVTPPPA